MRRLLPAIFGVLIGLTGNYALSQSAALTTPVSRNSEFQYVLRDVAFNFASQTANIDVAVQDSGAADIRIVTYVVPDPNHAGATFTGFLGAVGTVRASETGTAIRKANFRVLGFLFDNGYLPAATLNP